MILIPERDYRAMPWKNGCGSTREIAIFPSTADIESFDWRVSIARQEAAAPFSTFPNIDRTIAILDGAGLQLDVAGGQRVTRVRGDAPYTFPADNPARGIPLDGPVTDLNVMSRRGRCSHTVKHLTEPSWSDSERGGSTRLLFARGACRVGDGTGRWLAVDAGATARLEGQAAGALAMVADDGLDVFLIDLFV